MEEPESDLAKLLVHHHPIDLQPAELLVLPQEQALSFQDQELLVETLELPMVHHTVPITELPMELELLDQFQVQDQVLLMELLVLLESVELTEVDYQVHQAAMEPLMVQAVETLQEAEADLDSEPQVLLEESVEQPEQLEQVE